MDPGPVSRVVRVVAKAGLTFLVSFAQALSAPRLGPLTCPAAGPMSKSLCLASQQLHLVMREMRRPDVCLFPDDPGLSSAIGLALWLPASGCPATCPDCDSKQSRSEFVL